MVKAIPIRQYGRLVAPPVQPNLLRLRFDSYQKFLDEGIEDALSSLPPIETEMPWRMRITLRGAELEMPSESPNARWREGLSYDASLYCKAVMEDRDTGEVKEQRFRLCAIPLMDSGGGFCVNGVRRVVIHQIVRAPGAYFSAETEPASGRLLGAARVLPERGLWLSFFTTDKDVLRVRLNAGGRAMSALAALRAFGLESDGEILEAFAGIDSDPARPFIANTIDEGGCADVDEAWMQIYAAMYPGRSADIEAARQSAGEAFWSDRRYSLGALGRHMLNRYFGRSDDGMTLDQGDVVRLVSEMIRVSNREAEITDVDDLANRRVRGPGETVYNEFSAGLYEMVRETKRKIEMSDKKPERPLDVLEFQVAERRLASFFSGSKLCQTTDETNPVAELTHKRRVTSLGPGGLTRRSAGVDPRDVHHTHYGKLCPIETPEGQNVGLLCTLSLSGQTDEWGLLSTPVRRVYDSLDSRDERLLGRTLREDIEGAAAGDVIDAALLERLRIAEPREVSVRRFVLPDASGVEYLSAYDERFVTVGQSTIEIDALGQIEDSGAIDARRGHSWVTESADGLDYLDLEPRQIISASTSLIPFLDHNDATRALMGCNMQRQAVPLVAPQTPLVGTGSEKIIANDSGYQILAPADGWIKRADADEIEFVSDDGEIWNFPLRRMERSNQFTCIDQRPVLGKHMIAKKGDALADGHAMSEGELALGQRVVVAYLSWGGFNYEDAIILSDRILKAHKFRTRVVKRFRIEASDIAGVGSEIITKDLHDVPSKKMKKLDDDGIVKLGSYVKAGDILVGKQTPRLNPVERRQTPEDKLLQRIFGVESHIRFMESSLRLPKGQDGRVTRVRVVKREDGTEASARLDPACHTYIEITVIGSRDVQPGDKMSGRHGNKGCVSIVAREEDMPFMEDGTPIDVLLNPLGVPSRMNLGQLMEVHVGWAAHRLGFRAKTRAFDSATWTEVERALCQAWLMERFGGLPPERRVPEDDAYSPDWDVVRVCCAERGYDFDKLFSERAEAGEETLAAELALRLWMRDEGMDDESFADYAALSAEAIRLSRVEGKAAPVMGKRLLRDGRTGMPMEYPVMVGVKYMLRLAHMVADKAHARSTGPYSSVTQQPLKGKSNGGGQRFGEMEVWALEGYSAAHTLREMLTIKSDDVDARHKMMSAVLADSDITPMADTSVLTRQPASFYVLMNECRALGLNLDLMKDGKPLDWGAVAEPDLYPPSLDWMFSDELIDESEADAVAAGIDGGGADERAAAFDDAFSRMARRMSAEGGDGDESFDYGELLDGYLLSRKRLGDKESA